MSTSGGERRPERTGTPFRGFVKTEESVPGPQNVIIRTGTVVPGPLFQTAYNNIFGLMSDRVQNLEAAGPLGS